MTHAVVQPGRYYMTVTVTLTTLDMEFVIRGRWRCCLLKEDQDRTGQAAAGRRVGLKHSRCWVTGEAFWTDLSQTCRPSGSNGKYTCKAAGVATAA